MELGQLGGNPGKVERYVLLGLVGLTFALYFFTSGNYGIFRDELYYFACGEHLDFGYVDHPPMVAIIAAVIRPIFGACRRRWRSPRRFFSPVLSPGAWGVEYLPKQLLRWR